MSRKYLYPQVQVYAELTNDDPEMIIVRGTTTLTPLQLSTHISYLRVEKMSFSVHQAAKGGGGKLRFQDQQGNIFWHVDVNGVKDVSLDFGEEGISWAIRHDIKAILYGAAEEQAKVWFGLDGHIDITGGTSS